MGRPFSSSMLKVLWWWAVFASISSHITILVKSQQGPFNVSSPDIDFSSPPPSVPPPPSPPTVESPMSPSAAPGPEFSPPPLPMPPSPSPSPSPSSAPADSTPPAPPSQAPSKSTPSPAPESDISQENEKSNQKMNMGKKVGLLFIGITGILQVAVFGFLIYRRWEVSKLMERHDYSIS